MSAIEDVVISVMTHNPLSSMRFDLLERTLRSMDEAFPNASRKVLFDNGSTDGSGAVSREIAGDRWQYVLRTGENTTPGAGRNALLVELLGDWPPPPPTLMVMSDDDMLWRPGAEWRLKRFWSNRRVPDDLTIVSGLLEPDYPWNTPRGIIEASGELWEDNGAVRGPDWYERALWRDSAPGCAWTFVVGSRFHGLVPHYYYCREGNAGPDGRTSPLIDDFGYDSDFCRYMREREHQHPIKVAQMDLAEHIGWGASTHGNDAVNDPRAKPLDREKWGI